MNRCIWFRAAGRGEARRADQRGISLLENLVAVVLVSIALIGLMAGLLTTISASSKNNQLVTANAALIDVTERMKNQPYEPCATPATYQPRWAPPQATAAGRPIAVRIDSVRYWDAAVAQRTFQPVCPAPGATADAGSQVLALTVTVNDVAVSGQVVVRNPAARPQ